MNELPRHDYDKVIKLLDMGIRYPEVISVIEGNNPGDVYVDSLAINCVNDILKEGKIPYWDCMEENIPSRKMTEKIGFNKSREYICYSYALS
ncbi:GNAT family N-acetyltransferase [Sporosalibacterium faouarense]|uniref:GNAT family N-acetyltransferase n=1 Tax=Sporosalibacterium faouarense TaxID=516123 RepID=UPI00192B9016|nr:GNAT family N-acetyltransferase [Sporosalibacterium faouarense]